MMQQKLNKRLWTKLICITTMLGCSGSILAQGVIEDAQNDEWRTSAFVYLWGTGLNGTARLAGNEVEMDASFSDLLEELDSAFSGRIETTKQNWGGFIDHMNVNLGSSVMLPIGANLNMTTKNRITEFGGTYRLSSGLQALFGARIQYLKLEIAFPGGEVPNRSHDWSDGFVGIRYAPIQTDNWKVWLRGDVGLFGDSERTWNAALGAAYIFDNNWSVALAYRYLSNDYVDGSFAWDVDHSGLGLALGYSW